ncbi:MAG: S49 family peptidase [Bacteroidota bacterium]
MTNSIYDIYKQVLTEPWAIDIKLYAQLPFFLQMLEKHGQSQNSKKELKSNFPLSIESEEIAINSYRRKGYQLVSPSQINRELKQNTTVIIPVSGLLTKYGGFFGPGMNDIAGWLENADQNDAVDGVVLVVDSPGGTVSGTEKLANVVKNMKKPVVSLIDGQAASAAYWIASCANRIYALNNTCSIGSIGIAFSLVDIQPKMKKEGYVFHDVVSDLSDEKNATFFELLKGNYDALKKETLNPLAEMFINYVKTNRPSALAWSNKWSAGKSFFSKEAIQFGLVDEIGDIGSCLEYIKKNSKIGDNSLRQEHSAAFAQQSLHAESTEEPKRGDNISTVDEEAMIIVDAMNQKPDEIYEDPWEIKGGKTISDEADELYKSRPNKT